LSCPPIIVEFISYKKNNFKVLKAILKKFLKNIFKFKLISFTTKDVKVYWIPDLQIL